MTSISLRRSPLVRFVGHYLEMVVAMVVGMVALAPLWPEAWLARGDLHAVAMAVDMTVAMAAWMLVRRHTWPRIVEMSAAMVLPFAVLLVPYWLGVLPAGALMIAAHVVMFPLMLAAMIWRRADYWH
jgi:flagellar biosynthetic protein FliP